MDVGTCIRCDGDEYAEQIGNDINLVIDDKVPRITQGFTESDRGRISERLKAMNNRTSLWLFLTIDIIGSAKKYRQVSNLEELLTEIPSQTFDAYKKILQRISDVDKEAAKRLFSIIVAAMRPLTLEEANVAMSIAVSKSTCTSLEALKPYPVGDFRSTVQDMCDLLVSVHDGKLSFIHQTARAFLLQRDNEHVMQPDRWRGTVDMAAAHA